MSRKLLDDCFLHDRDRLKHDDAIDLIRTRLRRVADVEEAPLDRLAGRVLATDVAAPRPVPAFTNAAVDGYAFAYESLAGGTPLAIAMRLTAGASTETPLAPGQAARIFTGAPMPPGADTCVMQEDVTVADDAIAVPAGLRKGANTRKAGEDVKAGDVVVRAGTRLRPQEVAAIASTGAATAACYRPLKVAVLSTGDELLAPGQPFRPGGVYDSNRTMIRALLGLQGVEVLDLGVVPDRRDAVESAVAGAAAQADAILSTGGASRGEADYVVETIAKLGQLTAWQIAVKPGRPLAIGQIRDTVYFGLPGNPVAAFVTFLLYAQPMLAILQGADWRPPRRYPLPAAFSVPARKTGRREFWRGSLVDTAEGLRVKKFERDGSGLISGLSQSDGLIDIPEARGPVLEGDLVDFIPYGAFGLP
ncbi:MAG: gephyrin-like molybdotransferase Glp [Hyphomicrobiales bacterium]